jgi:hypothetical protein
MAIWEYQIDVGMSLGESTEANELQSQLSKRGQEGWELVTILPRSIAKETQIMLIFKRSMTVKKAS